LDQFLDAAVVFIVKALRVEGSPFSECVGKQRNAPVLGQGRDFLICFLLSRTNGVRKFARDPLKSFTTENSRLDTIAATK